MERTAKVKQWIACPRPLPAAKARIFCFPYAGVGASVYHPWRELLEPEIELNIIQTPGRETRYKEELLDNMDDLIHQFTDAMHPLLDKPFLFFGHSLGALTCFETARYLRHEGERQPAHLIASGHRAPQLPDSDRPIHRLADKLFIQELVHRYKGMPTIILSDRELLNLFLPILRSDMKMTETYMYKDEDPFDFPITACGGIEDTKVQVESLQAWQQQTISDFQLHMFPGDHFYLKTARTDLTKVILSSFADYS